MLVLLRGFLLLFLLYHILVTVLGFGFFHGQFPQIPALMRDGIRVLFVVLYFFSTITSFKSYWKQRKSLRYTFLSLLAVSLFFSYIQDKSIYDMFVGFKYGFHYLFLFLSATFLGHIFAKQGVKRDIEERDQKVSRFLDFFVWSSVIILCVGYIWQAAKLFFPDFFFSLGYGPLNDFQFGTNPPLYYLTGFGGTLRWQGIFSGPNNYGYFLVAFLPLIISYFKFSFSSWKDIFTKKQNLISLFIYILRGSAIILTLSRSALLGTLVVLFLLNINWWKRHWKMGSGFLAIVIIGILGLSFLKSSSTVAHIAAKFSSIRYVLEQPLGYGLGSSGPAIHHNGTMLPENYFIQLLIDIGLIGFTIFAGWYRIAWKKLHPLFHDKLLGSYIRALVIGWIALLVMGVFLHVFEDSMVNYSFFVLLGVLCGYLAVSKKELSK